jgi:ubiquinone/menaquinone biosynthesis C-methylase UbiE
MPTSDKTAHKYIKEALQRHASPTEKIRCLDLGMGGGETAYVIREYCPQARIVGLEIYAKYLLDEDLREYQRNNFGPLRHDLYDSLILGDMGDFRSYLPTVADNAFDFVIFGDSLEHVTGEEGEAALEQSRRVAARAVIVSTPLVRVKKGIMYWVPQGELFGNPHEAHRKLWRRDELEFLGGVWVGAGDRADCLVWDCRSPRALPITGSV